MASRGHAECFSPLSHKAQEASVPTVSACRRHGVFFGSAGQILQGVAACPDVGLLYASGRAENKAQRHAVLPDGMKTDGGILIGDMPQVQSG